MIRWISILLLMAAAAQGAIPIIFTRPGTNAVGGETNEVGSFMTNMWIDAEDYNYGDATITAGGYFPSRPGTNFNATGAYAWGVAGVSAIEGRDFEAWDILLDDEYRSTNGVAINVHDDNHEPNGSPYTDYKIRAFNGILESSGDWFNYAREFTNDNYRIYARVSSTVNFSLQLSMVGDHTWGELLNNQSVTNVASFSASGQGTNTFFYQPFMTNGLIYEASISDTNCFQVRITNGICDFHRLMLVRWTGTPMGFADPEPSPDVVFVDENGTPFYDPEI